MRILAPFIVLFVFLLAGGCINDSTAAVRETGLQTEVPAPTATITRAYVTPLPVGLPLSVETYEADYAFNGSLLEHYVYRVEAPGTLRMLFRNFDAPLVFSATGSPHIELVGIQPLDGVIGYARDASGTVRLSDPAADPETVSFVAEHAGLNEVGLVDTRFFSGGTYDAWYSFVVRPPVEYDASLVHVNLMLAGAHVPYSSIRITVPADRVHEVFVYPPTLKQTPEGDRIVITGGAGQDERIAVELLLERSALDSITGFPRWVDRVGDKTRSAFVRESRFRQP